MGKPFKNTGKVDHTPNFNVGSKSDGGANVFAGKYQKLDDSWAGRGGKAEAKYASDFNVKSTDDKVTGNPNQPMKSRGNA